jgi:fatty-acyl-CoA synthase
MLAPSRFNPAAFTACYGMAECSLAVSFSPLDMGIQLDAVDPGPLADDQTAVPVTGGDHVKAKDFVKCGFPLPGFDVEIRSSEGRRLPERRVGTLFVRGPSVMSGYFGEDALTREVLSRDGWLNTGDLAYVVDGSLVITGRQKDLIIINGRNIWPQDLEYIAESQPEVRTGDASAFSVTGPDGDDTAVLVIECRESSHAKRQELVSRIQGLIRHDLGIDCFIELVTRNTLPRTTSGKLSRSGAKKDFLQRVEDGQTEQPGTSEDTYTLRRKVG